MFGRIGGGRWEKKGQEAGVLRERKSKGQCILLFDLHLASVETSGPTSKHKFAHSPIY